MLAALVVPAGNDRGPLYAEQALSAIHQANPHRYPLTLSFIRHRGGASLACGYPEALRGVVETQLYAAYPECRFDALHAEKTATGDSITWTVDLHAEPEVFPLKRYSQFDDPMNRRTADPLTAILAAVARDAVVPVQVQLRVRPSSTRRVRRTRKCLERLSHPFLRAHHRLAHFYARLALSSSLLNRITAAAFAFLFRPGAGEHARPGIAPSRGHERESDLLAAGDKLARLLFDVRIRLQASGPRKAQHLVLERLREVAGAFGQFSVPGLAMLHAGRIQRHDRPSTRYSFRRSCLLSAEELATLWHAPTATVQAPAMARVEAREFEPPLSLPTPRKHGEHGVVGVAAFRGNRTPFGILLDDRRRHLAIVGKTGMGKSTLLHRLIASDIIAGRGAGLIDPHGDLAEAVLRSIPSHRTDDVVLFDAGDTAHPVSFNVLHCPRPEQRPLLASGIVSAFKKLYADSWGPRLEHILRNAALALMETPDSTLLSLVRILSDPGFRRMAVSRVRDPVVRQFWEQEFARLPPRLQAEAIAPVQNKVGAFVSSPILRNIVGQPRNRIDLRRIMDEGRILIVNLSKGRTGDDASALLGSLLVTSIQLAAMSRAEVAEDQRRDFFLYVDEFQNFATESFATILSEARKYRLALTLANQYLAQVDEQVAAAVFGNVGTLVTFQVGADDAESLAAQLAGDVTPNDLLRLPRYHAYARLLIDGQPSRPFSVQTLPPAMLRRAATGDRIRRYCRQRYARSANVVERGISAALASSV